MIKKFHVYILASKRNGTLYIGVTSNLVKRIHEQKSKLVAGFTRNYDVSVLVYYEEHSNAQAAITREKQLKKWRRKWKLSLIEKFNPTWADLYKQII